jgi:hypothetical protein
MPTHPLQPTLYPATLILANTCVHSNVYFGTSAANNCLNARDATATGSLAPVVTLKLNCCLPPPASENGIAETDTLLITFKVSVYVKFEKKAAPSG